MKCDVCGTEKNAAGGELKAVSIHKYSAHCIKRRAMKLAEEEGFIPCGKVFRILRSAGLFLLPLTTRYKVTDDDVQRWRAKRGLEVRYTFPDTSLGLWGPRWAVQLAHAMPKQISTDDRRALLRRAAAGDKTVLSEIAVIAKNELSMEVVLDTALPTPGTVRLSPDTPEGYTKVAAGGRQLAVPYYNP